MADKKEANMADERQHSSIVVDGVEQAPSRAMLLSLIHI